VKIEVASDSTNSIRSSLHEIEVTLIISILLVVLVVSVFLRNVRATIVPTVATVVSLLGTFGVMYLLGFSLNNLSLMALTVATGFVVDDAIVVLENTTRHIEAGMDRFKAALLGAREVGFTVLSISLSLIAVFIPLLFMGGQFGALFKEFAVTLSAAVMISLVISLTTTPMMCAWLLSPDAHHAKPPGRVARFFERGFDMAQGLRACAGLGAAQRLAGDAEPCVRDRPEFLPVRGDSQRRLPAAGYGPDQRRHPRRPEHLVPGHAGQAAPAGQHHQG
jgi:multidrug efflux pump